MAVWFVGVEGLFCWWDMFPLVNLVFRVQWVLRVSNVACLNVKVQDL